MAIGSFRGEGRQMPVAEINVVPLVDVMLVLLVVFIITAPLLTHSVKIDLPKASSAPNLTRPDHVELAVRADGSLFWNGAPVAVAELPARFAAEAKKSPQPELHLRADRQTAYEHVAVAMSAAARAGMTRIGFVTEPEARAAGAR